jgi:hypothetical protein
MRLTKTSHRLEPHHSARRIHACYLKQRLVRHFCAFQRFENRADAPWTAGRWPMTETMAGNLSCRFWRFPDFLHQGQRRPAAWHPCPAIENYVVRGLRQCNALEPILFCCSRPRGPYKSLSSFRLNTASCWTIVLTLYNPPSVNWQKHGTKRRSSGIGIWQVLAGCYPAPHRDCPAILSTAFQAQP